MAQRLSLWYYLKLSTLERRPMPTVMIYQSPRSAALRATAIAAVTDALVGAYDLRPEQIQVYFHEVPDDRCGKAGRLASGPQEVQAS
jgi:phenylpyruvate tautomerase PptA (4-oxalocrotonate tautomerase family)